LIYWYSESDLGEKK